MYFDNNSSIQIREQPDKVTKVYLDKKARVYNLDHLDISNRGTVSPRTIIVRVGNKVKRIKVQMTWGRMVED